MIISCITKKEIRKGEAVKALAQEHMDLARKIGVQATPTFFIKGQMVVGADLEQHDAVFGLDLLRRHRLGKVVGRRVTLQAFAAFLRVIDAGLLPGFLGSRGAERLERLGVRAFLPDAELIAGVVFLVADAAGLDADIIRRVALSRNTSE